MKMLFRSIALIVLTLGLSAGVNAQRCADSPTGRMNKGQARMQQAQPNQGAQQLRMMAMLDLSQEQTQKIEEIHLNGQKGMLPLRTSLQEKNAKLRTLTFADQYDEKAVNAAIKEVSELRRAMMVMRTAHQQQIRELLTEEQRIKFDTFHLNAPKRPNRPAKMNK